MHMDEKKLKAIYPAVYSVIATVAFASVLLKENITSRMAAVDDTVISTMGKGIRVLLIIGLVLSVISALRNCLWLFLVMTGREDSYTGTLMLHISQLIGENIMNLIMAGMGALFMFFGIAAIKGVTSGTLKMQGGGEADAGMYIVCGIFIAAGLAAVIVSFVKIIKSFKDIFS